MTFHIKNLIDPKPLPIKFNQDRFIKIIDRLIKIMIELDI